MTRGVWSVLSIDNEKQIHRLLRLSLRPHGYLLLEARSGAEGIASASAMNPDLILLELGLPDLDGMAVMRRLRKFTQRPIFVLSIRDQEEDKVNALDAGADDYITKPFAINELLARIRVAQRRTERKALTRNNHVFSSDALQLDVERRQVVANGRHVHLTPVEWKLIAALTRQAGKVVTHQELLEEVWGTRYTEQTQYLRVYMRQLRAKLEPEPARPRLLVTEPCVGYRLRAG